MTKQISIVWCADDVRSLDSTLTDQQCSDVLELVDREHDAEVGVTWDTLKYWIDEVKSKKELSDFDGVTGYTNEG